MEYSKEGIAALARSLGGFQTDFLEKSLRLLDMLREVSRHGDLKERLVLKGGTAINFMQKELPRLSVDIDFNCLAPGTREEIEPIRKETLEFSNAR